MWKTMTPDNHSEEEQCTCSGPPSTVALPMTPFDQLIPETWATRRIFSASINVGGIHGLLYYINIHGAYLTLRPGRWLKHAIVYWWGNKRRRLLGFRSIADDARHAEQRDCGIMWVGRKLVCGKKGECGRSKPTLSSLNASLIQSYNRLAWLTRSPWVTTDSRRINTCLIAVGDNYWAHWVLWTGRRRRCIRSNTC